MAASGRKFSRARPASPPRRDPGEVEEVECAASFVAAEAVIDACLSELGLGWEGGVRDNVRRVTALEVRRNTGDSFLPL